MWRLAISQNVEMEPRKLLTPIKKEPVKLLGLTKGLAGDHSNKFILNAVSVQKVHASQRLSMGRTAVPVHAKEIVKIVRPIATYADIKPVCVARKKPTPIVVNKNAIGLDAKPQ